MSRPNFDRMYGIGYSADSKIGGSVWIQNIVDAVGYSADRGNTTVGYSG
jgi:hypothetical protein